MVILQCRRLWAAAMAAGALAAGCPSLCDAGLSLPQTDERLNAKVSLELSYGMLGDALAKLSEQTGVSLAAGTSDRDWKVRERRITVCARDVPLIDLLSHLTSLLGYSVSQSGEQGKYAYVIWQDRNARTLEADLMASQRAEAADRAMKTRQAAFDSALEALKLPEAQAYVQKDLNPWLAWLGGTKAGRGYCQMLQYLDSNFPTERDLILRGKRATISLENLPPDLYEAARDTGSGGIISSQIKAFAKGEDPFKEIVPHQMVFMSLDSMGDQSAGMMGFGGLVSITGTLPNTPMPDDGMNPFGSGIPMSILPLSGTDSPIGNAFGKMLFALDEGATLQEATTSMTSYFSDPGVMAAALGRHSATETAPPSDPALTREVELKDMPTGNAMAQGLDPDHKNEGKTVASISGALGIPVLLESFGGLMPISAFVRTGKQPAYQILAGLEKAGYVWAIDGGSLRIRPDDWAMRRSYEVPESVIKRYEALLEKQGEFRLEDLAMLASELSDEQIQNNLIAQPKLSTALSVTFSNPMGGSRELLRFYGSLSTGQRQSLQKDPGLSFDAINDAQWEHLALVISDKLGGVQVAEGSVLMKGMPQEQAQAAQGMNISFFEMRVLVAGEEKPRTLREMVMVANKQQIEQIRKMQKDMLKSMGGEASTEPAETPQEPAKPNDSAF